MPDATPRPQDIISMFDLEYRPISNAYVMRNPDTGIVEASIDREMMELDPVSVLNHLTVVSGAKPTGAFNVDTSNSATEAVSVEGYVPYHKWFQEDPAPEPEPEVVVPNPEGWGEW